MNQLQVFKNELFEVAAKVEGDTILFDVEQVAKCLGISRIVNGKEYVRWERVNSYLPDSCPEVGKGDLIPEPMVYKLAFKASNEVAEKFQDWLAIEVIPKIRKNGYYMTPEQQAREHLKLSIMTSERVDQIEQKVESFEAEIVELKENIYITSSQAKTIRLKVSEKVYEALGGKNSNAFKHLRNKTYRACWRDFWNYFDINEYRELPRVKYEEAIRFLIAWQPNTALRLEIEHYNTQLELRLVK
ncbi:MAG: phage antirepressor [Lysinibacillus sp.]|nr:phage antirepressor [Lysinibacillus sp.]